MILLEPEFYDFFGIFVFLFLIFISWRGIKDKKIEKRYFKLIFVIGILGFFIDLIMVLSRFFFR